MGTTTTLALDQRLLEAIGDWLQHPVTTLLAASTAVVSTHLTNYRATADYFNNRWIYIEDKNNLGVSRQILDDDGTNTLTLRGANLSVDTEMATFRISYFSWLKRLKAINAALEEAYPNLYVPIDNRDLITMNYLPPFRWSSSTALDLYATTTATIAKTTTGGLYWNGANSAKVTVSAANGYLGLSSTSYPRLLDLMGQTVTLKCWAYPEVANDAWIRIYTLKADGTAQTLTSTTTCPAGKYTLLELEDQTLNDDLVQLDIRMGVLTNTKYAYFSQPRISGRDLHEYLLPNDFDKGSIARVLVQYEGFADDIVDDLKNDSWVDIYGWEIKRDGTYKYLWLPYKYGEWRQLKILGEKPFDTVDDGADTVNLEGTNLNLLVEYAAYKLYDVESQRSSAEDKSRYEVEALKHKAKYNELKRLHTMTRESRKMNIAPIR